jgi:hypothetical protein
MPAGDGQAAKGGLYGVMAAFASPEDLEHAARRARDAGYLDLDAFTPFPVEGVKEALGFRDRKVQATMLVAGIAGALLAFAMETSATVYQYPHNIGGRPDFSWPAYIIIIFELTVLCSGISGLVAVLFFNGLPRPHHPVFAVPGFERATRDRFFLLIGAADPRFRPDSARAFLAGLRPLEVIDVAA